MVTASPSDWKSAAVIGGVGATAVADLDWERWRSIIGFGFQVGGARRICDEVYGWLLADWRLN
ncbi:hypothetical protein CASFOL_010391 [Castilleja foliolosa]|uniref:Uncharacterized protein n=1 Tax=Castilleja foliolosa TaxID=1961234 RepID=A0ABD3CQW6_9LAMI